MIQVWKFYFRTHFEQFRRKKRKKIETPQKKYLQFRHSQKTKQHLKCLKIVQPMQPKTFGMDKGQLTGLNLCRVFNNRCGCVSTQIGTCTSSKNPNLQLKTWPKQVLGSLTLAFALPSLGFYQTLKLLKNQRSVFFSKSSSLAAALVAAKFVGILASIQSHFVCFLRQN